MVLRASSFLAAGVAASLLAGCYSRATVPTADLAALQRGNRTAAEVVRDEEGGRVRLDPNSRVRFRLTDGSTSEEVAVSDLRVSDEGVFLPHKSGQSQATALRWDDVEAVEVENLDHAETALVVVGVSAFVAVIVAAVLTKGEILKAVPAKAAGGASRAAQGAGHAASGAGNVASGVARGAGHAVQATGRALATTGRVVVRVGPDIGRLAQASSGGTHGPSADPDPPSASLAAVDEEEPTPPKQPALDALSIGRAQPLFTSGARRQSSVKVSTALDVGRSLSAQGVAQTSVVGGVRLFNFVELGGGLRYQTVSPTPGENPRPGDLIPLARLGIHAELDARGRFAFPFALDVGHSGDVALFSRLVYGLRMRVVDAWSLGLYVFNPTYTGHKNSTERASARWSFPSGVETSFVF